MALEPALWRRRPVTLTPLIDIIFLLLLFFMLSSTFTRFAELPLMNTSGGTTQKAAAPLFLQLSADNVALNGETMQMDALLAAIAERASGEDGTTLMMTLSGDVSSQRLVDLLAELRGAPGLSVSVLE